MLLWVRDLVSSIVSSTDICRKHPKKVFRARSPQRSNLNVKFSWIVQNQLRSWFNEISMNYAVVTTAAKAIYGTNKLWILIQAWLGQLSGKVANGNQPDWIKNLKSFPIRLLKFGLFRATCSRAKCSLGPRSLAENTENSRQISAIIPMSQDVIWL